MKLSYHRRVQAVVDKAVDWYEEQSTGLGDDFFGVVDLADTLTYLGLKAKAQTS